MRLQDKRLIIAVCLSLLAACATTTTVQNAPMHAGVARTYSAPFEKVLSTAREAVVEAGLKIDSANQVDENSWLIVSVHGAGLPEEGAGVNRGERTLSTG